MKRLPLLAAASVLLGVASPSRAAPPSEPAAAIVCRGESAEGFSYEWGGECWCGTGCVPDLASCSAGTCTPNPGSTGCPNCTHSGTYGTDCSGLVSKAWQVPDPHTVDACNVPRYLASDFTQDGDYWNVVPMDSLQPADAVASSSHAILVLGYKDAAGEHEVIEAKGCNYGVVRHSRTFSSSYSGARRVNITDCVCNDGDQETQACGDCGSQQRSCDASCQWSAWSPCDGPDPTGADASCTIEGAIGSCAVGRRLCVAGWRTCQAELAATEICDGEDNDCDGIVDNGTPDSLGEGYDCQNACGAGKSKCIDGALRCVTPGTTWPDDSCAEGIPSDAGGGCACSARRGAKPIDIAPGLVLLGLLLGRRRRARV